MGGVGARAQGLLPAPEPSRPPAPFPLGPPCALCTAAAVVAAGAPGAAACGFDLGLVATAKLGSGCRTPRDRLVVSHARFTMGILFFSANLRVPGGG